MKKAHLSVGGDQKPLNGTTLAVGSPAVGVPLPSIVVSGDTAGGSSPGSSPSSPAALTRVASSDRPSERKKLEKKEKLERERQEKLEKKEQKRMEKERLEKERLESKKSPKAGDSGGKLDLFLGSKITMEKFFKKKLKEREDRKEKKEEERERERILASEVRTSSSSMSADEGGSSGSEAVAEKKKKKRRKKGKKVSKGYHSEGSNDENGGSRSRKKHSRRGLTSSASSTGSSSTTTTTTTSSTAPARSKLDEYKDPAEREVEREEEKETESETDDSSSSDDSSTESMDEEEDGKGMLHPHARLQRRKNWTVSQEFRVLALETEEKQKPDFSFALQHKNRDKNRYGNALPNPETRVVLRGGDTDYINANYIQGEETQYIAAQAPLPNTFGDFWLMVWEQNTRVIMMLTRLTENDRTKAEIYWPRKGPLGRARGPGSGSGSEDGGWKQFGKMRVSLVKTSLQDNDEDVTIRHFRLRKDDEVGVERQVIQIHFTGWPDFGVPQNTRAFTQLLALMEGFNKEPTIPGSTQPNGPIVLHCSAGLGRTGTLIAAHIAAEKLRLKRVKSKDDIDMKAIVAVLREQRSGMVQTKCQYKFLHDLLNDL